MTSTNQTSFSTRLNTLEAQVLDAVCHRLKRKPADYAPKDFDLFQQQIVALGSMGCNSEADSNRLIAMMLLCAYLRKDKEAIKVFSEEVLKALHGKKDAKNPVEAYLFICMYTATRNPEFRDSCKAYVQKHSDFPAPFRRIYTAARNAPMNVSIAITKHSRRQQELILESSDKHVFHVCPSEELTAWTTDGMQDYRLVTIESAVRFTNDYKEVAASRRPEHIPSASDSLKQLRCHGGIALARRDPDLITRAFQLAEERLNATDDKEKQMSILEAMYHIAGCDGSLLMASMKLCCDRYFDQHFADMKIPTGLFPDEIDSESLAYRLLFCRHLPKAGVYSLENTPQNLHWLQTLRNWADKLIEQKGSIWHDHSLAANFQLQRYILQTGYLAVADGDERKAMTYRNHINGAFFDCYLQLVNERMPDVQDLVCCYPMLREWKYDIEANEKRYAEFIRVVSNRQQTCNPASNHWKQLEEIKMDYMACKRYGNSYKLICKG